jgi:hypothetical protein
LGVEDQQNGFCAVSVSILLTYFWLTLAGLHQTGRYRPKPRNRCDIDNNNNNNNNNNNEDGQYYVSIYVIIIPPIIPTHYQPSDVLQIWPTNTIPLVRLAIYEDCMESKRFSWFSFGLLTGVPTANVSERLIHSLCAKWLQSHKTGLFAITVYVDLAGIWTCQNQVFLT